MKKIAPILIGFILAANTNLFSQSFGSEIMLEGVTVTASYDNSDWSTYWELIYLIDQVNQYYDSNNPVPDCTGDEYGDAYYDQCGICVGGSTGQSPCSPLPSPPVDCNGETNGSAYIADCGCIGGTTGITECPTCDNPVFESGDAAIVGGATPSVNISGSPDFYGRTYPEFVTANITVCLDAGSWKAITTGINGHYSQQVQLAAGVNEVVGQTNSINYCKQVQDLRNYGQGSGITWYTLSAVQAHEDVHLSRFEPGLEYAATTIEGYFEALSVPNTGQGETSAIAQIFALPAFTNAKQSAYLSWRTRCDLLVLYDDIPGGYTEIAEQAIVFPLASSICTQGITNSWPTCTSCQ